LINRSDGASDMPSTRPKTWPARLTPEGSLGHSLGHRPLHPMDALGLGRARTAGAPHTRATRLRRAGDSDAETREAQTGADSTTLRVAAERASGTLAAAARLAQELADDLQRHSALRQAGARAPARAVHAPRFSPSRAQRRALEQEQRDESARRAMSSRMRALRAEQDKYSEASLQTTYERFADVRRGGQALLGAKALTAALQALSVRLEADELTELSFRGSMGGDDEMFSLEDFRLMVHVPWCVRKVGD